MWRDERGSVSPLWVALVVVVMILATAILEREWVNYKLRLASQTADFAAEAGGRAHEAWAKVTVSRYQYWWETVTDCIEQDDQGGCISWETRDEYHDQRSTREITDREKIIQVNWRALADCGTDGLAPNWQCNGNPASYENDRWVIFAAETEEASRQTFTVNWQDQNAAVVENLWVAADAGRRKVIVQVDILMRPLFGIGFWTERVTVRGAAVVKLNPMSFQ
jgi:hypothetical protein